MQSSGAFNYTAKLGYPITDDLDIYTRLAAMTACRH
ncbi:hypothetical protein ACLB1S_11450 [Escherichia coli]